jgi:hypothetical protein
MKRQISNQFDISANRQSRVIIHGRAIRSLFL